MQNEGEVQDVEVGRVEKVVVNDQVREIDQEKEGNGGPRLL